MKFSIINHKNLDTSKLENGFILVPNSWNDYSFRTQYTLFYLTIENQHQKKTQIGTVKILKRGQTDDENLPIEKDFTTLEDNYISLGQSLDYYQRIIELEGDIAPMLLSSLRDAIYLPHLIPQFREERGWKYSLLRGYSEGDSFFETAKSILFNSFEDLEKKPLVFSFKMKDWDEEVIFDFSPTAGNHLSRTELPNRLIALIGRNGTGKSTLLSRIARIAHGTVRDRTYNSYTQLGLIKPENITFPRIITVSYSAFDSFRLPGVDPKKNAFQEYLSKANRIGDFGSQNDGELDPEQVDERDQIISDMVDGRGRYIFCGLRDIAEESKTQLAIENSLSPELNELDKLSTTLLKSLDALAIEFEKNIIRINDNGDSSLFDEALSRLVSDPSFGYETIEINTLNLLNSDIKKKFKSWSTGHKIVMQIISSLAAHTTNSSLILIDEPETYLHPPLLATLMHSIRYILNTKQAYAIVATHSPVVLQETLVKNVYKIQGNGSNTEISTPSLETFGENIGTLTTEIFGLNSNITDFYKTLNHMITEHETLESIESHFKPHGLSTQARAYVISNIAKRKR
ncbi:AAA family ATPase [Pseudomonas syringae]|uniref:AAA family ATPase n=1 Tax=Pseudomonas syringae TaxID=317 RepID=UPI003F76A317